jgi:tape measure domain-containing protein
MAVTADVVQVRLEADTNRYVTGIRNAERTSTSAFARMSASARTASASVSGSLQGLAGAFLGTQAIRGGVQLIDTFTGITNSLKVAGLEGQALTDVYDKLFESAQRNAAPVQSLAQLYGRVAIVQKELGASTEELLGLTDTVAKALRVAGTDAQGASGALLQLSQAMGAGVVRAEEFNSILEGALPLAQAAAAGLEEAGGSVAKFRQLVVEGKISSEVFFRSIEAGAYILDERLAGAETTVSQAFVRLQNVLIDVAGEMNEGSRVSNVLSGSLDELGTLITDVAAFANAAVGPIAGFIAQLETGVGHAQNFANELARISGLEAIGASAATFVNDLNVPGLSAGSSAYGRVIDQTFSLIGQTQQDETLAAILAGNAPPEPLKVTVEADEPRRPISLNDYDAPNATSGSKGKVSAIERERQAVLDLIDTMEFERSLISLTAREKEIETAARQAGSAATAEQIEYIRELAAATYDENEAIQRLNISSQEWADTIQQATRGFIDDLIAGKDAAEAFSNVLSSIANKLIDVGLNSLFGTGGFNVAGLFGGGRAQGGPVSANTAYMVGENGPEMFVPYGAGKIVPNGQTQGGGGSVVFSPVIDARGADVAAVARLEQSLVRLSQEIVPTVRKELATAHKKGR